MPKVIDVELAGLPFQLFAERGLYWPTQSILFVADTHFGKEATFRRHGIPVPAGTTDATLERISGMLKQTSAKRLCILGDMFHARSSLSAGVCQSLENFFVNHSDIDIMLVRGNHDASVGKLPSDWPIETVEPGMIIGKVAMGHHPSGMPTGGEIYLCGHIHPAIRVSSRIERLGKLPCFWYAQGQLVLPAIGEFTGTHVVTLAMGDQAWITSQGEIFNYR